MRSAHHPSGQTSRPFVSLVALAALLATGCASDELAPSIWPPPDFLCVVEQLQDRGGSVQVVRRVRIGADAVVVYAASQQPLIDAETGTVLPVFDRVTAYRLVPASLRAFARRLDRLGVAEMDVTQGERRTDSDRAIVVDWTAFGARRRLFARGRVLGPMADVLAAVMAHLPDGERFEVPGMEQRPIVPVLRGVPPPRTDVDGAFALHEELIAMRPADAELLLDAFALACRAGRRETAVALAERWLVVEQEARAQATAGSFPDAGESLLRLEAAVLQRLIPPL